MSDQAKFDESINFVRLALPLMTKYRVPATPKNYTVWYCYVSGADKELNKEIDELTSGNAEFSEETNDMLYRRFFSGSDEGVLREMRGEMQEVLVSVFTDLAKMSGQADNFENVMSKSMSKLDEDIPVKEIKKVVGEIITETKVVKESGHAVNEKLKEANNELEVLKKDFEHLRAEAFVDFLTGVANRRSFDRSLLEFAEESTTDKQKLCLLMIDIDHFKKFNDTHGHIVGDKVLKYVAKKLVNSVRGGDFVACYGGEEFSVILPETPLKGAAKVAENIRNTLDKKILQRSGSEEQLSGVTVSIGVAQYRYGEEMSVFIARADAALYQSKENGRNRVTMEAKKAK